MKTEERRHMRKLVRRPQREVESRAGKDTDLPQWEGLPARRRHDQTRYSPNLSTPEFQGRQNSKLNQRDTS